MKQWTVIALYADDYQPYATAVEALTVEDAERAAQTQANGDNRRRPR